MDERNVFSWTTCEWFDYCAAFVWNQLGPFLLACKVLLAPGKCFIIITTIYNILLWLKRNKSISIVYKCHNFPDTPCPNTFSIQMKLFCTERYNGTIKPSGK